MGKQVSVKDIAKELNISLSTVHKALTGKGGISEQRRKEVVETAQRMGYQVNSIAQILSRKAITLGIIMPTQWQQYFAAMKEGMEEEIKNLKKYKVQGVFYEMQSDIAEAEADQVLNWLEEKQVDALIYCTSMYVMHEGFLQTLKQSKLPIFLSGDRNEEIDSISEVTVDAKAAGRLAADFLRCIKGKALQAAVFTGSMKIKSHKEKVEAFIDRVQEFGGIAEHIYETGDDPEKTAAYMTTLCQTGVNAVYVSTATSGPVCAYLEQNDPEGNIALICTDLFDELKYFMKKNVAKATIYQRQAKVGSMAVRTAYDYLVKKSSYGNEEIEPIPVIKVHPSLYLLADIEE